MKKRWYEDEKAESWMFNDITAQSYQEIYKILHDKDLLEVGVKCMALEEGFLNSKAFNRRVEESLKYYDLKHDAATYLLYKQSFTLEKAKSLFLQLQENKGVDPSIIEIYKNPVLSIDLCPPESTGQSRLKR